MNAAELELLLVEASFALRFCAPLGFVEEGHWNELSSGTCSLIRINGRQFGITCDHVIEAMYALQAKGVAWKCGLGKVFLNDPIARVLDRSKELDIAVLDLAGLDEGEIGAGSKMQIQFLVPTFWPPECVKANDFLAIGGFPGKMRQHHGADYYYFRSFSANSARVEMAYEDRIGCRLELDQCLFGTNMRGEVMPDLAGTSGGLAMVRRDTGGGFQTYEPVGIIREYSAEWDMVYLTPLSVINQDGTIRRGAGEMLRLFKFK